MIVSGAGQTAGAQWGGHVGRRGRDYGGGVPAGKEPVKVSAVSFFISRNNSPFELLGGES